MVINIGIKGEWAVANFSTYHPPYNKNIIPIYPPLNLRLNLASGRHFTKCMLINRKGFVVNEWIFNLLAVK